MIGSLNVARYSLTEQEGQMNHKVHPYGTLKQSTDQKRQAKSNRRERKMLGNIKFAVPLSLGMVFGSNATLAEPAHQNSEKFRDIRKYRLNSTGWCLKE